jgi:hypothetical protein
MAISLTETYQSYGHKLTKGQRKKLERYVEPYYDKIIKEINSV